MTSRSDAPLCVYLLRTSAIHTVPCLALAVPGSQYCAVHQRYFTQRQQTWRLTDAPHGGLHLVPPPDDSEPEPAA